MAWDEGPLATSPLAVGRFAAKKGSLSSPRGQLVASLVANQNMVFTSYCTLTDSFIENDIKESNSLHLFKTKLKKKLLDMNY